MPIGGLPRDQSLHHRWLMQAALRPNGLAREAMRQTSA